MTKIAKDTRQRALEKLAFFGPAAVSGSPFYTHPPMSVGQTMYAANASSFLSTFQKRQINNRIVATGADVNSPVKNILKAGIGALAGNFIANALKAGPFMRGMITATGANYGYNY